METYILYNLVAITDSGEFEKNHKNNPPKLILKREKYSNTATFIDISIETKNKQFSNRETYL